MSKYLLELKQLSKLYVASKQHVGIDQLNFKMRSEEWVAILGASGCGKSTLLRMVAGLVEPSAGEILYRGEAMSGVNPACKMVFQHYALLPWLTLEDNIALGFGCSYRNLQPGDREWTDGIIDMIGLSQFTKSYPGELSGGMCQRVGFARALVTRPELLLLDEAFSALDSITARKLRRDFHALWLRSAFAYTSSSTMKGVLMVTHDVREAVELADRIIILSGQPSAVTHEIVLPDFGGQADRMRAMEEQVAAIYEILEADAAQRDAVA